MPALQRKFFFIFLVSCASNFAYVYAGDFGCVCAKACYFEHSLKGAVVDGVGDVGGVVCLYCLYCWCFINGVCRHQRQQSALREDR